MGENFENPDDSKLNHCIATWLVILNIIFEINHIGEACFRI